MSVHKNVAEHHKFYLRNGSSVKNLKELIHRLKDISEEDYNHHVTKYNHDFHNWVKDVYKEDKLAKAMLKAKNREELIEILESAVHKAPQVKTKTVKRIPRNKEVQSKLNHHNKVHKAKDVLPTKTKVVKPKKETTHKTKKKKKNTSTKAPKAVSKETYSEYLQQIRQEFYEWANEVLKDRELAAKLMKTNSREEAEQIIDTAMQAKARVDTPQAEENQIRAVEEKQEVEAKEEIPDEIKTDESEKQEMPKPELEAELTAEKIPEPESFAKPKQLNIAPPKEKKGFFKKLFGKK